jgi:hypothetical protein
MNGTWPTDGRNTRQTQEPRGLKLNTSRGWWRFW